MSESQVFQFPRAYFGTLIDASEQPQSTIGAPRIIAQTPDITPAQIGECVRLAKLPPPILAESAVEMPGALGLFRGETIDFIFAKAQYNDANTPQIMYILVPSSSLRRLGGHLLTFWSLGMMDMPTFSTIKNDLVPFELRAPQPPTVEEQSDSMMDLLLYCQDSFRNVESILAGLIQGWPLAIVNSPVSLEKRLKFIQGLLSLLPVPARVGITFATHVRDPQTSNVQIKFMTSLATPDQHLVYDWGNGQLLTPVPEDSYSRYIVSQLRLDPSLVINQTEQLSRTTVWRAMNRENLGKVLAWVSRRAAVDQAVRDGQPADRETVAAILREDPTLSNELRLVYARHLLAFAIALNEPDSADVIPTVCVTNSEIAQAVIEQLRLALQNQQAQIVYELLERWLLRVPEASTLQWHTLLHGASKFRLQELLKVGQAQPAMEFINHVHNAPQTLRLREVTPDLVRLSFNAARANAKFAQLVLLTAIDVLPAGELYRILGDPQFHQHLPADMKTTLSYLEQQPREPIPPHVLAQGASVFGEEHRALFLARLVEWAMYLERLELIDSVGLQAVLSIAQTDQCERFRPLIQQIVDDLSVVDTILALEPPGARILVQLLLQIEEYDQAVAQLEFYQNVVYGSERLVSFTELAGEVFQLVQLSALKLSEALAHLEGTQIRPEPRVMIFNGVLNNEQWTAAEEDQSQSVGSTKGLDYALRRLTTMIFNDYTLITVMGTENALRLLNRHARSKNALDTLRVAAALVDHALQLGKGGEMLLLKMWPVITWNAEVTEAAFELVRRFVRGIPLNQVPEKVAYFENSLGKEVGSALQATHLMRWVVGENDMLGLTEEVHIAMEMFLDLASVYHTDKDHPPVHRLRNELDTMPGGLSEEERQQVGDNMLAIARLIYELGQESSRQRGRIQTDSQLIQGQTVPTNGMDMLFFIGGHFARHQLIPLGLKREEIGHIFGTRSAAMLLRETTQISRVLSALQAAFSKIPVDQITPQALAAELESQWGTLSVFNQRQIQSPFARSCQQLGGVIRVISDGANERAITDSGPGRQLESGKKQPHAALEALRWIHGYFNRKHAR